ncbi:hypothetical protein QVD17_34947 [Tagetes erecta]|uniref:Uncharacterized protein n=1 Tax=Tagetes erecta TaxID=13708 RepID=A0AAD8NLW5_TARER|nr:hypothetical protein QVD17_34947 [Tagetes erecta]
MTMDDGDGGVASYQDCCFGLLHDGLLVGWWRWSIGHRKPYGVVNGSRSVYLVDGYRFVYLVDCYRFVVEVGFQKLFWGFACDDDNSDIHLAASAPPTIALSPPPLFLTTTLGDGLYCFLCLRFCLDFQMTMDDGDGGVASYQDCCFGLLHDGLLVGWWRWSIGHRKPYGVVNGSRSVYLVDGYRFVYLVDCYRFVVEVGFQKLFWGFACG